jgi:hypothetical protein
MISKFLSSFSRKSDATMYSYLPDQIQDEIKSAMEATSIYDIR